MPKPTNKPTRNLLFWLIAGGILIIGLTYFNSPAMAKKDVPFSQFMSDAEQGKVEEVTIQDNQLRGKFTDGQTFKTILPAGYTDLIKILRDSKVNIIVKDTSRSPLFAILMSWFPILLLILFWVFFMRQMQAGGNKAMAFGKSRAKLFSAQQKKVTFKDVAGVEEAEYELGEIIEFLREPQQVPPASADASPRASSSSAPPARARPCWPGPWPAKPTCPSSRSAARTSSRCSSASAPRASATSSTRARSTPPA